MNTLISIIIPTFNSERLLPETLNSVLAQTYSNLECIIVDDGSTDSTQAVLRSYVDRDPRIRFFQRSRLPKSASTCRNIGLENAKGDWVIFLDSDDLLAPTCLEGRIGFISQHSSLDFAVFKMESFSVHPKDGRLLNCYPEKDDDSYLRMFIRYNLPWSITCPLWRKGFLKKLGGFSENFPRMQDPELHVRALFTSTSFEVCRNIDVDCYYRLPIKRNLSKGFYSRCFAGFILYIQMIINLINTKCTDNMRIIYLRDLRECVNSAIDILIHNRNSISISSGVNLLWSLKKMDMISWYEFFRINSLFSLPELVISIVRKYK